MSSSRFRRAVAALVLASVSPACGNTTLEPGKSAGSQVASSGGGQSNPACASASVAVMQGMQELSVGTMQRRFRLSVPDTVAGRAMPVIVAFHGGGGRDIPFPQQELFDSLVQSQKVIVAYPLGELIPPNEGEWLLNTTDDRRQDIDMVDALLDELRTRFCIDEKRIYAMGYSLGAMFNYDVLCQLNQRFAAVVPVAGSMPKTMASCDVADPVALLHIHGIEDPIIPYGQSWGWKAWPVVGEMRSVPNIIEYWRTRYNCEGFDDTPSGSDRHIVYDRCDGGVRVEHYGVTAGGHEWPDAIDGLPTAKVVWDFMREFEKP